MTPKVAKRVLPRVLIGSPRYGGEIMSEAHEAREWAEDNKKHPQEDHVQIVQKVASRASLLAWAFNQCFAEALNWRDAGKADLFAMQHSDVSVPPGWCNELYRRMRIRGDVVVSAVVPMKDHERIRTSTAVGVRDQPFNFRRYINTSDRPGMPETFATQDVAQSDDEILLINTGLWICDLRWPGWNEFEFTIKDAIRKHPETGRWMAWVVSEDWNLAHYLDKHGAPYSACWLPGVKHHGYDYWSVDEFPPVYPQFVPNGEGK